MLSVDCGSRRLELSTCDTHYSWTFLRINDNLKLQFNFQAWVWWILMYAYHISRWILPTRLRVQSEYAGGCTKIKRRFFEFFKKFYDLFNFVDRDWWWMEIFEDPREREREMSRRIHLQFDEWKALKNQSIFSLRPSSPLSNCTSEKV